MRRREYYFFIKKKFETYIFTSDIGERVAADDDNFVILVREPEWRFCEIYCPRVPVWIHVVIKALPTDVQLHPCFGVGDGDIDHLERPRERPVVAVDAVAVETEAMVDGALIADAERVWDVDVAAPRQAVCWPAERQWDVVGCRGG